MGRPKHCNPCCKTETLIYSLVKLDPDGQFVWRRDHWHPQTFNLGRSTHRVRWHDELVWSGVNTGSEIQRVRIEGAPTGGTFTLTFEGQTTSSLNHDATAGNVQTALRNLSTIASTGVVCSGGPLPGSDVGVRFANAMDSEAQPLMTGNTSFTGGDEPELHIDRIDPGRRAVRAWSSAGASQGVGLLEIRQVTGLSVGDDGIIALGNFNVPLADPGLITVAKWSSSGSLEWTLNDSGFRSVSNGGAAFDGDGHVYIVGSELHKYQVGSDLEWDHSTGGRDVAVQSDGSPITIGTRFVIRRSAADGSTLNSYTPGITAELFLRVAVDPDDNVLVAGNGGVTRTRKLSPTLVPIWDKVHGRDVAADLDGNVVVAHFGNEVKKYDPAGNELWVFTAPPGGINAEQTAVATDDEGNVYVGYVRDTVTV